MNRSEINLNLGDSLEAMKKMDDNHWDLAICDPPYGIDASLGGNGSRVKKYDRTNKKNWDSKPPTNKYFEELFRVSKNQIIFGMNYFSLPPTKGFLVWDKAQPEGVTFAQAELIYTSFTGTSKIIKGHSSRGQSDRIHPTQKPVSIYKKLLLDYAKEGDKILDTHGGSMSIALACHNLKYDLDLWELDADYHAAGVKRFEQHKQQIQIF